jgi:(p)ppGpp synthase/HD superfamily hydrolase
VPSAAWESLVATGKARSAIRRATRAAVRRQYAGLGRKILDRAFERAERAVSDELLKASMPRLGQHNLEDMLAAVGRGEIPSEHVVRSVYPDFHEERAASGKKGTEEGGGWFGLKRASGMKFRIPGRSRRKAGGDSKAIPIRGIHGDMPVRFAPEGGAVPGDRIIGILTPGEGITVYPIQSPVLKEFDNQPERWLDVTWDIDENARERFPARLALTVINEPGSLAQVAQVMGDNEVNITALNIIRNASDYSEMTVDVEVWDLKHLSRLLTLLRDKQVVSRAQRVNG